jgi:hypothetical protein
VQGGVCVSPGAGGAHGGELVSPAKAAAPRRNVRAIAAPSVFGFFMVFSFTSWLVLGFMFENDQVEAGFKGGA